MTVFQKSRKFGQELGLAPLLKRFNLLIFMERSTMLIAGDGRRQLPMIAKSVRGSSMSAHVFTF